jgi:hypothetical protein
LISDDPEVSVMNLVKLRLSALFLAAVTALALPQMALAQANTCRWANDNECE